MSFISPDDSHSSHDHSSIRTLQTFYHLRQSLWNWRDHQNKKKWKGNARIRQFIFNGFHFTGCWCCCYQYSVSSFSVLSHSANYLECCHGSCFSMFCESALFFSFFSLSFNVHKMPASQCFVLAKSIELYFTEWFFSLLFTVNKKKQRMAEIKEIPEKKKVLLVVIINCYFY